MLEDYDAPDGEGGICPKMDELLCEYVDGTMDPTVQDVFEECICADPVLAERVHELRGTRSLLNRYGHKLRHVEPEDSSCSSGPQSKEESETPSSTSSNPPLRRVRMSTLVAAVAASLVVGMLAGKAVFGAASEKQHVVYKEYTPIHKTISRSFDRQAVHNTLSGSEFSTQTYHNIFDTSMHSTSSGGK